MVWRVVCCVRFAARDVRGLLQCVRVHAGTRNTRVGIFVVAFVAAELFFRKEGGGGGVRARWVLK